MSVPVKICGLKTKDTLAAAVECGAAYIGFNFFPKSPRSIDIETARVLSLDIPVGVVKVGLTVDAPDTELARILELVPLDMLQLHGHESPTRVQQIKNTFGLPVMKAIGISDAEDLDQIEAYARVADQLLIDAKKPKHSPLPGGNGLTFDWRLIAGRRWPVPWMLAGGLTPENLGEAVALTGAPQIDVASGVESGPGEKDIVKIRAFLDAARERAVS